MKLDKQTENNAQLFFRNVIEETGFIDKLRSVTQVIKGRLSQHDTRNAEKIVYPYEYLFTVILLAGMAGFKTKDEVRLFWRTIYATEVLSMRDVLACDGQAMRATDRLQPDGSRSGGKQITSIVSYETGMTLGQAIHNKKNQEKQDILELSKDLDISNTILTWDAINTHPGLVEFVISKQADVFASLKSNQGRTFEEIEYAYGLYQKGEPSYRKPGHYATATGTVLSGGYFYNLKLVL